MVAADGWGRGLAVAMMIRRRRRNTRVCFGKEETRVFFFASLLHEYWKRILESGNRVCYQCNCELKLKDCVYWEQIDYVKINTDVSNGQNSLEPKPSELGLSYFVSNVIHIRNKYDSKKELCA
jgi:hypothetical protein